VYKVETSIKKLVFFKYPEYQNDIEKNITLTYCIYGSFYAFFQNRNYKDRTVIDIIGKLSAKLNT